MDAHDGGNCDQLGLFMDWHCCQINCNQLGLCADEYIVKSITISSDCVLIDVNGGFGSGFDGGFDGGFDCQFHLAVLGYQPQQSV